jgi:hypothetical protein
MLADLMVGNVRRWHIPEEVFWWANEPVSALSSYWLFVILCPGRHTSAQTVSLAFPRQQVASPRVGSQRLCRHAIGSRAIVFCSARPRSSIRTRYLSQFCRGGSWMTISAFSQSVACRWSSTTRSSSHCARGYQGRRPGRLAHGSLRQEGPGAGRRAWNRGARLSGIRYETDTAPPEMV